MPNAIIVAGMGTIHIRHLVCRNKQDCRLLPANHTDVYEVDSHESLEPLAPAWQDAIHASRVHNVGSLLTAGLSTLSSFFLQVGSI